LWRPIARAIVIGLQRLPSGVGDDRRRELGRRHVDGAAGDRRQQTGAEPPFQRRQATEAERESGRHQSREADRVAEAVRAVLEAEHRILEQADGVLHDVDEDEGEDADGEHGEADPGAVVEPPDPAERQAEKDGEAGEGAEQCRFSEGHRRGSSRSERPLGNPNNSPPRSRQAEIVDTSGTGRRNASRRHAHTAPA
jgi:hypothetical protein